MGPEDLERVLRVLPPVTDRRILTSLRDDAAVLRLTEDLAVIQTVDYITPVVNDPYVFGQITAANALSDVYAMGGRPVMALNLVGFPNQSLPLSVLEAILRGGADKAAEAGVTIAGGHSITDNAPKYGLAVTGTVDPRFIVRRTGAQPGDLLVLTKPLGTGAVTTGIDRQMADPALVEQAVRIMTALNDKAAAVMIRVGVHACTDVTGFGLLGHLWEMLAGGDIDVRLWASRVPVIEGALALIEAGVVPAGTHHNLRYMRTRVEWEQGVGREMMLLLCDPQTSGGLLMAVSEEKADDLLAGLRAEGVPAAVIGVFTAGRGRLQVTVRE